MLQKCLNCLLTCLLVLFSINAWGRPLPSDSAFQLSATAKNDETILLKWVITPGYYLYRDQFKVTATKPKSALIGNPLLPSTKLTKHYPGIGKVLVYKNNITVPIPVAVGKGKLITLRVHYQGCADAGFCYPPTTKTIAINLAGNYMANVKPIEAATHNESVPALSQELSAQGKIIAFLKGHSIFVSLGVFFLFGITLSLTPCVLPMIPIVSSILIGQKKIGHLRSFSLSLSYVLGMSTLYGIIGLLFGWLGSGQNIQASLQQPWLIGIITLLFIAMALSLFGLFTIQLPEKLRNKLNDVSQHQKHTYLGVFFMGALATLLLSPCAAPPLGAALTYITQTGKAAEGAASLFAFGFGAGLPLLIIGLFGPKLLPKSGQWMNSVKYVLGVAMLAVAIWMLSRIVNTTTTLILVATLCLGCAISMGALSTSRGIWQHIKKALGLILFIYAILLTVSTLMGAKSLTSPLHLSHLTSITPTFSVVTSLPAARQQLRLAKQQRRPALLDFYAHWCYECQLMDAQVFGNPAVQRALKHFVLIRADITQQGRAQQQLQRAFHVYAPPALVFYDRYGRQIKAARIDGGKTVQQLLYHLKHFQLIKR